MKAAREILNKVLASYGEPIEDATDLCDYEHNAKIEAIKECISALFTDETEEDSEPGSDFFNFANKVTPYRVDMMEYERGWGSKLDETLYFYSKEEAQYYARTYNAENNTEAVAPDYYITAIYVGV